MPAIFKPEIEIARIMQKLDDHIVTQTTDFSELKATMLRIELKLDSKAGKDELDKFISITSCKADKSDLQVLENRIWVAMLGSLTAIVSAVLTYIFKK